MIILSTVWFCRNLLQILQMKMDSLQSFNEKFKKISEEYVTFMIHMVIEAIHFPTLQNILMLEFGSVGLDFKHLL